MQWVLIFWLFSAGGVPAASSVPFRDEAACHTAWAEMQREKNQSGGGGPLMRGVCVRTATE